MVYIKEQTQDNNDKTPKLSRFSSTTLGLPTASKN